MPNLPIDIPKSLASYAEHFDDDPLKATTRLKKQLKKRGPDAVGHFLLAWFYHLKGVDDDAVEHALKAKIYAPGSPFLGKLHYYLAHPNLFEAWQPPEKRNEEGKGASRAAGPGPVLDLDRLIEKLSEVESERIDAEEKADGQPPARIEDVSSNVDDIVSETLANIHETQGNVEAAINIYRRLKELNTEKKEFYRGEINRLKQLKDEDGNEVI